MKRYAALVRVFLGWGQRSVAFHRRDKELHHHSLFWKLKAFQARQCYCSQLGSPLSWWKSRRPGTTEHWLFCLAHIRGSRLGSASTYSVSLHWHLNRHLWIVQVSRELCSSRKGQSRNHQISCWGAWSYSRLGTEALKGHLVQPKWRYLS